MKTFLIVFGILLFVPRSLVAQESELRPFTPGTWAAGLSLQGGLRLGTRGSMNLGGDFSAAYFLTDRISLGAHLPISYSNFQTIDGQFTNFHIGLGAEGRFYFGHPSGRMRPFVLVGLGLESYSGWRKDAGNQSFNQRFDPYAELGAGLLYRIIDHVGLEMSVRNSEWQRVADPTTGETLYA
ncbi:hypothetical protein [Pontibacter sp. G13]|uniref:hypothetical protein n=1 Tax=Pontibacter sp. G13 TaxID=3074898 RepID=UPI002889BEA9|nr:hypothetical protein [Pontibacter sp. G13]WNJ20779.1 hypothetical protein RJD25_09875 [Pontibacter sp. G13]